MPLKFAANLSWLFTEAGPLDQRYAAAKEAGFQAVECALPYALPLETVAEARRAAGVEQVLINCFPGDREGDAGLAAKPSRLKDFKESLEKSIQYAKALDCKMIHVMSGCRPSAWKDTAMDEVYLDNIRYAADRLQQDGIVAVIEPINSFITVPNYFMDDPYKAVEVIKKLNHPNLKLQLDIYHLQLTAGNLSHNIKKFLPYTAHIQIAQAPDRYEPESAGEVCYDYVFKLLQEFDYQGWIGLEFKPSADTHSSIQWTMRYAQ